MGKGSSRTLDASVVGAFSEVFAGEIVLPGDRAYDAARVVWNGTADRRPAIVVRPTGVRDVVAAVRFGREQELAIAVRSGGHSIAGLSTCDDGIVIDLSRMRGATVDPDRRVAKVNGGALLAELDDAAQAHGLACPVGVVSHTGVAGLTLGGGMGRLQRRFGLTLDNLRSVDLVTAGGETVHASEDEHPELFWGLRGAGPNFGIVTSFEFDLHPVGPIVTHGAVFHPADRATDLALVFRELEATLPDEVFLSFAIAPAIPEEDYPPEVAGRALAMIGVLHSGSPEDAERDLARLRAFGAPVMDTIATKTYLEAQHLNDEGMSWGQRFYMKSGFTGSMPDEMVSSCATHVEAAPGDCSFSWWACGRAIARVPDDATAFSARAGAFWSSAEVLWEDPARDEAHVRWGREGMALIEPYTVSGRYVNDVAESGPDVVRSVYGDAKLGRLVTLKREWDPDNALRLNQNIQP